MYTKAGTDGGHLWKLPTMHRTEQNFGAEKYLKDHLIQLLILMKTKKKIQKDLPQIKHIYICLSSLHEFSALNCGRIGHSMCNGLFAAQQRTVPKLHIEHFLKCIGYVIEHKFSCPVFHFEEQRKKKVQAFCFGCILPWTVCILT